MDIDNLRNWFKLIYEVFLVKKMVQEWLFHKFFLLKETIDLMEKKLRM